MDNTLPSVTFKQAHDQYLSNIKHARNLVEIHRKSGMDDAGKSPKGKRGSQTSLNRAIVLMTVASWQATIEDLAAAAFHHAPGNYTPQRENRLTHDIEQFGTPATHQVRHLLSVATPQSSFDPAHAWTWTSPRGRGIGVKRVEKEEIASTLDAWVKIRHAVAHGHDDLFDELTQVEVCDVTQEWEEHNKLVNTVPIQDPHNLISIRAREGKTPSLTLGDAERCLRFFENLTRVTALGVMKHVGYKQDGRTKLTWTDTRTSGTGTKTAKG